MRVLVTGANGFVGRRLLDSPARRVALELRAAVRHGPTSGLAAGAYVEVGDINSETNWTAALRGIDAVVHTAARVHIMRERSPDGLAEFRRVNVEGTRALANQAVNAGVKRFVFLSSVKVNGEWTAPDRSFREDDPPRPIDPYGISKAEAEDVLRDIAHRTGLEVVIVRPVLLYGPGVRGNFLSLLRWVHRGVPLPFGAIDNRRSLAALANLVDLVDLVLVHPNAANQTFLISDGEDVSTRVLIERIACALHARARLIHVPVNVIDRIARLVGRSGMADRLLRSLQVDTTHARRLIGWEPIVRMQEELAATAAWFMERRR